MADVRLDALWKNSFPDRSRPMIYSSEEPGEDGFNPLTDAHDFLVDDLQSLTAAQLYTLAANDVAALQALQGEWMDLERLATHIRSRDLLPVHSKNPQQLPSWEVFEERKEADLYSYKYEANRPMVQTRLTVPDLITDQEKYDLREDPEPFRQAGLVPNEKQYKSLMVAARLAGRERNPDNQLPYLENLTGERLQPGTWIARMMPPDAPPPPRTRARETQLNGAFDRQTRFNGEKTPMTRQVSSNTLDGASPEKRTTTPIEGMSPAPKRRRIETFDVTDAILKPKHPNQYTKRRETALTGAQPVLPSQNVAFDLTAPPKRKHPNQYTKRREREEGEWRLNVEMEVRAQLVQEGGFTPQRLQAILAERFQQRFGSQSPIPGNYQLVATNGSIQTKPKHPNQYTKQRDAQERATMGLPSAEGDHTPLSALVPERRKHPNQWTKRAEREQALREASASRPGTPSSLSQVHNYNGLPNQKFPAQAYQLAKRPGVSATQGATHASIKNRDPTMMTKEELRTHLFKDHELIAFLQKDHSWLNEDPEKALQWKGRILASDYPVRTWAMLRKWKDWKDQGKDKRPRDKDGNRIRDVPVAPSPPSVIPVIHEYIEPQLGIAKYEDEDIVTTEVGIVVDLGPPPSTQSSATETSSITSPEASPLRRTARSARNRPDMSRLATASPALGFQAPRNPLVNGFNAREPSADLPSPDSPSVQAQSFDFSLKAINEIPVDSQHKVSIWQDKAQTDYTASTAADRGARATHAQVTSMRSSRLRSSIRAQGTEDDTYPGSGDVSQSEAKTGLQRAIGSESQEPLQASNSNPSAAPEPAEEDDHDDRSDPEPDTSSASSTILTDSNENDDTYRTHTRTRIRSRPTRKIATVSTQRPPLPRTQSTRSIRSTNAQPHSPMSAAAAVVNAVARDRRTTTLASTNRDAAAATTSAKPHERTATTRRAGLRQNPPKRRLTGESLGDDYESVLVATAMPTRRSLRNVNASLAGSEVSRWS